MRVRAKLAAAGTAVAALATIGLSSAPVTASSHREAPLISQDPVADNTDVYMFRDKDNPAMVNIVANYIGLEQPASGPNFQRFGDDVLYEIHIDNNGDVVDDITYQFRFRTALNNPDTFLFNTGRIDQPNNADPDQNIRQVYSVRRLAGATSTMQSDLPTPPVNIGPRSTPNYEAALAAPAVQNLTTTGGGNVFAGQRKDPFFVDLGSIFDLGALRPIQDNHLIPTPGSTDGVDGLDMLNVHSIVLQLPITSVLAPGANAACATSDETVDDKSCVIGVYASSSRQRVKVLSPAGGVPRTAGRWTQVSRLGFPLVNEVLIPLGEKDRWNSRDPKDDLADDGFAAHIVDPELADLLPVLYPGVFNANGTRRTPDGPRADIVAILSGQAQGLTGDNLLPPADLLRLNVSTPVTEGAESPNGLLGGNADGFPNGRRLGDDVVDIAIQVVAGVLHPDFGNGNPANPIPGTGSPGVPYSALQDGVGFDTEQPLLDDFPYVPTPISGYNQPPTNP
ncbi:MAG: DUF4331 domain-containing protein [Actinomycetota bacterium]|nr:DUF4331 domain-containing protein [Actinomycetota bacterium]